VKTYVRLESYTCQALPVTAARARSSHYVSDVSTAPHDDDWRRHLIDDDAGIARVIGDTHRIAVLGIKIDPAKPAHYVPAYAQQAGFEIVPVPVYYPEVTEILGERVYRTVSSVPGNVDMVNVFRRSSDVPPHVDDILAKQPKSVWMQAGIRNDAAAEILARAGIDVVQDRCLMVELRHHAR
jgi:predicted CoA-binding protein